MKKLKNNKKGFTLVELLVVIVILSVIIIILGNTALPMMGKLKKNGMLTYAERVVSNAATSIQADSITNPTIAGKGYSIEDLMGSKSYFGCVYVKVDNTTGSPVYTYTVLMYSKADKYQFKGETTTATFDGDIDTLAPGYGGSIPATNLYNSTTCNVAPTASSIYKEAAPAATP